MHILFRNFSIPFIKLDDYNDSNLRSAYNSSPNLSRKKLELSVVAQVRFLQSLFEPTLNRRFLDLTEDGIDHLGKFETNLIPAEY